MVRAPPLQQPYHLGEGVVVAGPALQQLRKVEHRAVEVLLGWGIV